MYKKIFSFIILFFSTFILILLCSCNKKNIDNNSDKPNSYITMNDMYGDISYCYLPYNQENIDSLCKVSPNSQYVIHTDNNDLTKISIIVHSRITGIHFGSEWDEMTEAPDFFCAFMFAENSNIISECNLPKNIVKTSDHFCECMFYNCSTLTNFNMNLLLPNSLEIVGDYFCYKMFANCEYFFTFLNADFTIPETINTIGSYFCSQMFANCVNLLCIPKNFYLPQDIIMVDNYFCSQMFLNCKELDTCNFPDYKYGTYLKIPYIETYNNTFCSNMFSGCSLIINEYESSSSPCDEISIMRNDTNTDTISSYISYISNEKTYYVNMPYCTNNMLNLCKSTSSDYDIYTDIDDLTITTHIAHDQINGIHFGSDWDNLADYEVAANFCAYLFYNNTNILISCDLPKKIIDYQNNAFAYMFAGYKQSSLPSNFTLPQYPPNTSDEIPESFHYGANFCAHMFEDSYLTSLPKQFKLLSFFIPTEAPSSNCFREMFKNSRLMPGDKQILFKIPNVATPRTTYCLDMFAGCEDLLANQFPQTPNVNDSFSILRN